MSPLLLVAHDVLPRPPLYLSDYLDRNRSEYFDRLKAVSCRGEWEEWVLFFLRAVEATAHDGVGRIQAITSLRDRYRESVLKASSTRAPLAAMDIVMEKVIVSVADVQAGARCSYPTARKALDTLVALKIVAPDDRSYPAQWIAAELISVAYEN